MPDSDVLVPGTGGITLMDNQGRDLGYPVRMRLGVMTRGFLAGLPAHDLEELLSMGHEPGQIPPSRTSLKPGVSIRPGRVLRVAYNQIPASTNIFLYDWRADMRHSAAELLRFLVERRPRDGRWNVIGHSQGGLLIVLASKLMAGPEEFSDLVRSVTLVGAPIAGTVNAAVALISGDQMGDASAPSFRKIVRTWPALYQMLPAWPALVDEAGHPVPLDRQITTARAWEGTKGIDEDLLTRAVEAQALLRDPLSHMRGDIRVAALLARNRPTAVELRAAPPLDTASVKNQMGDTLVPHDRTLSWLGGHFEQFVITYPSPCNAHSMLCDDPAIASRIRAIAR
jgi:pimeloyl-ACP methyl ester carboxylesterase